MTPPLSGHGVLHDGVVAGERHAVHLGPGLEQPGAALDVREEEGDDPRRQRHHRPGSILADPTPAAQPR